MTDQIKRNVRTLILAKWSGRPVRITLRSGATATRAYVHEIGEETVSCGTSNGTVHAIYPWQSIAHVEEIGQ